MIENNVLMNELEVYYTVEVGVDLVIEGADYSSLGVFRNVRLGTRKKSKEKFYNLTHAENAALFCNGKVLKHTINKIMTEQVEEIEFVQDENSPRKEEEK